VNCLKIHKNIGRKRKKMKKYILLLVCLFFVIAGCSKGKEEKQTERTNEVPKPVEVSIQTPETINVNTEVPIQAVVTQGGKTVDDADDVQFEIWKAGQEKREKIAAKHEGKGVYSIKKTFLEDGTYSVIAHVQVGDLHTMPQKDIVVGKQEKAVEENKTQSDDDNHEGQVSIEFRTNEAITVNKEVTLSAVIKNQNQPLTEAAITFEVWPEGQEQHEFIDATEGDTGEYTTKKAFAAKGVYQVQVHVKKGEIHDHKPFTIEVE